MDKAYNYKIKKSNGKAKYLYLDYDDFHTPLLINNTRHNTTKILIIVSCSIAGFIALVIIIVIIACCCCCKKSPTTVNVVYPNSSAYTNQKYGQIPNNPQGSEIRINK